MQASPPSSTPAGLQGAPVPLANTSSVSSTAGSSNLSYLSHYIPRPLIMNVLALRRPELFVPPNIVEYAEPGDILFNVQQKEWDENTRTCGPQPVLSFPSSASGRYFVGEMFRGFICLRNTANYQLLRLFVRSELFSPTKSRSILYDRDIGNLDNLGNKDFRIESRFQEEGEYDLQITVSYTDSTYDNKRLAKNFKIRVERAFAEVDRCVHFVPCEVMSNPQSPPPDGTSTSTSSRPGGGGAVSRLTKTIVSFTLQNVASIPLVLTNIRFVAREGFTLIHEQENQNAGLRKNTLTDAHMEPRDSRTFLFELTPKTGPVARHSELGHVEWDWKRCHGDGGMEISSLIRTGPLPPRPDVQVHVQRVEPLPLTVDCPAEIHLRISNQGAARRDVLFCVIVEKLIPFAIYSGPCQRFLGFMDPETSMSVTLLLTPILSGFFAIDGVIELRDANNPDVLLWPPSTGQFMQATAPSSSRMGSEDRSKSWSGGVGSSIPNAMIGGFLSATTTFTPAKLCDIFVTSPSED